MKEITLSVSEFQAKCLQLLKDVETEGDRIVITKRGRPIAEVVPLKAIARPLRGMWKDSVKILGDVVYFSDNEWESEKD
ncbi:MAG TPA: type II toxin-antitoxin system Phd/YefM family antitoxin [Bryobacteraceae bacterium]|nr:type II toxin-antitoxin system Phd/YefM family antitoxin [Bryobacteraceae bacterium]